MNRLALSALALLAPSTAFAQISFEEQHIAVDVRNELSTRITIDAIGKAVSPSRNVLLYTPPLPVTSVTVDGVAATLADHPAYPGQISQMELTTPLTVGDTVTISMVMDGPALHCSYGGGVACVRNADELLLTPSIPSVGWYLTNLMATDPFVGTIRIEAPDDFSVTAGQGSATAQRTHGDGTATHEFAFTVPTEGLSVYAGRADTVSSESGFPVEALYHAAAHDVAHVSRAVDLASQLWPLYEEQYGALPLDQVQLVFGPKNLPFGAIGLLGRVVFNGVVVSSHDYLVEQGTAHELAHTWFGNVSSGKSPIEAAWLGESFAEYAGWKTLGKLQGEAARVAGMRMNAVWYMYGRPNDHDLPIIDPALRDSDVFVHVTYHKGPLVVRAFEELVGEAAFTKALKLLVARGLGETSVAALIDDVMTTSNVDLSGPVQQWLMQTGFPHVAVGASVGNGLVSLELTNADPFHISLPVTIVYPSGAEDHTVLAIGAGTQIYELVLAEPPAEVRIDPAWTMVREVSPKQRGDVTLDGRVDGADLMAVALATGTALPEERRIDGGYDPLFDVNGDRRIDDADLAALLTAVP